MREIELTQDQVALVDDDDFEWVTAWKWHAHRNRKTFYVEWKRKKNDILGIHNVIWEHHFGPVPEGYTVDHIDNDGLNNQKLNLRLATATQQHQNQRIKSDNTSGYKGVSFHRTEQKWQARITINHKRVFLGYFSDPAEAAQARDRAVIEHYGDFANLNFPLDND